MGNTTLRWGALCGIGAVGVGAALALRERQVTHRTVPELSDVAPRVVILGAGFGGLTAARTLVDRMGAGTAAITLVDRNNYHLFTPLLYQIAACGVDPWDTAQAVRAILQGDGITFRARISLPTGPPPPPMSWHGDCFITLGTEIYCWFCRRMLGWYW